jgi:hypothetical protein
VGFGTERYIGRGGTKSYWQIDAYHQADIGQQGIKTVLVSGCGDGGLIDVVRFRLTDFNHSLLLSDFEEGGVNAIAPQLLAIEDDARSLSGRDVSAYLYGEYKKLEIPNALTTAVKARLRKDTRVTLNGKETSPLTLDASILNRLAVFLLMQYGGVNYLHGELDPKLDTADTGYSVTLKAPNGEIERHAFDEVILRHGPEPLIGNGCQQHPISSPQY